MHRVPQSTDTVAAFRAALLEVSTDLRPWRIRGEVREIRGNSLVVSLPKTEVGALLEIQTAGCSLPAIVIGFERSLYVAAPLAPLRRTAPGDQVTVNASSLSIKANYAQLGSVVGSFGEELERMVHASVTRAPARGVSPLESGRAPEAPPMNALARTLIRRQVQTGIRAIDAFLPLGYGQRMVVFAEPGVGKSSLMESILIAGSHRVNVVALIGERGREVRECIDSLKRSGAAANTVVVVATSDRPAICRVHAAWTAISIAEYFRDAGADALLIVDSITRFCRALRDLGLGAGEHPVRRGYASSVFSRLPEFVERAGPGAPSGGNITALYTALLSGELEEDPMVEEIRGLCDGHIFLSKTLAEQGLFPAIDILKSISRLSSTLLAAEPFRRAADLRAAWATIEREEELVRLGGAPTEQFTAAKKLEQPLRDFLKQPRGAISSLEETFNALAALRP